MSTHLHVRSSFSLLQSTIKLSSLIEMCKKFNVKQIALSDYRVMHGAMLFNDLCKANDIKPIFGLELDILINNELSRIELIAKNNEGYYDLVRLSSLINTEDYNFDENSIKKYVKNCFFIVYGEGGYLEKFFLKRNFDEGLEYLKSIFDDFVVAISYNDAPYVKANNQILKQACKKYNINTVALSKIYYLNEDDNKTYRVMKAIKEGKTISDHTLASENGRFFRSEFEMQQLYDADDLKYSDYIADNCNVNIEDNITRLPSFKLEKDVTSKDYLIDLCKVGLKKRFNNKLVPQNYVARLKHELDIITSMHFEDYFLIVYDFIRYSYRSGIYVGPGRGSACGSLVAYCLGITRIDPIKYDLLFERFLNPERITMPDIDIDFPDNRREEVIEYVLNKYGKEHIAHICTFGTFGAKQVIRDVGRVLNIPIRDIDMLSKAIPNTLKVTLKSALKDSIHLKTMVKAERRFQELFSIALKLEGLPRHLSTHAAGIVMSEKELFDVVPCIKIDDGAYSTQYPMEYLERLGLIKMDFLGLRNLTIIDEIVKDINVVKPFNIYSIPLDDYNTYQLISRNDTLGIFQLESSGMKNLIKRLRPQCFDDIVATIALFRPGPMENIPLYLENREHPDNIKYLDYRLEPILKNTYGVMIYQEQIMQVAQKMAGFSLAKADVLRRAMSKKKEDVLKSLQSDFIMGCVKNGLSKEDSVALYDLVLKFASYGFNKSHSVAYGLLAYQLAYLKANYPLFFYRSLLNSVIGSDSKTSEYIVECKKNKANILKPSVNFSNKYYSIERDGIRFPLSAIKNVGFNACNVIIQEREKGNYVDYFDFVARVNALKINRKVIESLIDSGALDEFKIGRKSMKLSLNDAINYAELVKIETNGQISIDLGLVSKPYITIAKDDLIENANNERNVLGFYLSNHPIYQIKKKYGFNYDPLILLQKYDGYIEGFAYINSVKQHRTKKGDLMAFINVSDESGNYDLVCMPNLYEANLGNIQQGKYILFSGKNEMGKSCVLKTMKIVQ